MPTTESPGLTIVPAAHHKPQGNQQHEQSEDQLHEQGKPYHMSVAILAEVWRLAPVSGGDLLVLLSLADEAGDDHRMAWISVPTIAKKSRMKERNVYNCLKNLTEAGVIEDVNDKDAPKEASHYISAVRRITESTVWRTVRSTPANIAPLHSTAPNPSSSTGSSTNQVEEELRSSLPNRRGGSGEETPAGTKRKRKKTQPPVDDDPQSAVWNSLEPKKFPARKETILDPLLQRDRPARALDKPEEMVRLFSILAHRNAPDVPGAVNEGALLGSFGRWYRNENVDIDVIRDMIETYWGPLTERSTSKPAWQDFLAQRGNLIDLSTRRQQAEQAKVDRYDVSQW